MQKPKGKDNEFQAQEELMPCAFSGLKIETGHLKNICTGSLQEQKVAPGEQLKEKRTSFPSLQGTEFNEQHD
jgi:hypothetical protein